jgi:hypothetical protein
LERLENKKAKVDVRIDYKNFEIVEAFGDSFVFVPFEIDNWVGPQNMGWELVD